MNVFLAWSNHDSKKAAEALRKWLPQILPAVHPFVSTQDIKKGSDWSAKLQEKLSGADYGLLCVVRSNQIAPWMLFEAGALSISTARNGEARVTPILFLMGSQSLGSPLSHLQKTRFCKEDMWKLIQDMNECCRECGDTAREPAELEKAFFSIESGYDHLERVLNRQIPEIGSSFPDTAEERANQMRHELIALLKGLDSHAQNGPVSLENFRYNMGPA